MDNTTSTPGILRLASAVILGIIVGFILFLIVALFIGMFNNWMGMDIPVGTDIAENILSAVLLVIFVIGSIAGFCWKVWTTPPTEEEEEAPFLKNRPARLFVCSRHERRIPRSLVYRRGWSSAFFTRCALRQGSLII